VVGRRGRRRKQLLDDLKEKKGYWKLKEETLARIGENSLGKILLTCHNTDYRMTKYIYIYTHTHFMPEWCLKTGMNNC
jgi:hypothetical protein